MSLIRRDPATTIIDLQKQMVRMALMPYAQGYQLKLRTITSDDIAEGAVLREHLAEFRPTYSGMNLLVASGLLYLAGEGLTQFNGGSVTFTAPTSYPRIDLLVYDPVNGLQAIAGDEDTSPTAPLASPGQLPIAQVSLVTGMNDLHGAITDVRPFLDIRTYERVQNGDTVLAARHYLSVNSGILATDDPDNDRTILSLNGYYQTVQNQGTPLTQRPVLNFGSGLTASDDAGVTKVVFSAPAYQYIQNVGTPLPVRGTINVNSGLLAVDDPSNGRTTLGLATDILTHDINFIISGGGAAVNTGDKGTLIFDFPFTILAWTLLADQAGDIVIDVLQSTYANYPTITSITASAKPTLSSAQKATDSTLSGWTTSFASGTILDFNVNSAATLQQVTLCLKIRRTA